MLRALELNTAKKLVCERLQNLAASKTDIDLTLGKILAEDIYCTQNLPQFNRSIVDGYALCSSATSGASQGVPVILNYAGAVEMGVVTTLKPEVSQCVYVPTGGMVPDGSDCVVMIEHTTRLNDEVLIYSPVKHNENMIATGEDLAENSLIFAKGTLLNPAKIGVLAGAGVTRIKIYNVLKFALISTGDEIIPIEEKLTACKIRDINTHLLKAAISAFGTVVSSVLVNDDVDSLITALNNALELSDVVIISGGSSVGSRDFTKKAIMHFTKDIFIEGIALKPGKPTIVAQACGKLIMGLPGHPMAAIVAFNKVFTSALYEAMNVPLSIKLYAKAKINFPGSGGKATVMPVRLENTPDGYLAVPMFYKSGLISILAKADGYILIPSKEEGIPANTVLEVYPL